MEELTEHIDIPCFPFYNEHFREFVTNIYARGGIICGGFPSALATTLNLPDAKQKISMKTSDIDVYVSNEQSYEKVLGYLILKMNCKHVDTAFSMYKEDTPVTQGFSKDLGFMVQIIKQERNKTVYNILSEFDFTVCQAALNIKSNGGHEILTSKKFIEHTTVKRLIYNHIPKDANYQKILRRIWRYIEKGFKIPYEEYYRAFCAVKSEEKYIMLNNIIKGDSIDRNMQGFVLTDKSDSAIQTMELYRFFKRI